MSELVAIIQMERFLKELDIVRLQRQANLLEQIARQYNISEMTALKETLDRIIEIDGEYKAMRAYSDLELKQRELDARI